jgi:hypothetical protein
MGTASKKTREDAFTAKLLRLYNLNSRKKATEKYLIDNVGKEVKMSDRTYVIMPNGSYRRTQSKQDIRYSAKREKTLTRKNK